MSAMTAPVLTRRRFSIDEYEQMVLAGILTKADRVELLDGEIVEIPPIGPVHSYSVDVLTELFVMAFHEQAVVRVQGSMRLPPRSEPQPDLLLIRRRGRHYRSAHPNPDDTLLAVEVSDSTLRRDRDVKLPLYATGGVPEVWIVDVKARHVVVYRDPHDDRYEHVVTVAVGGHVDVKALLGPKFAVSEILGR